MSLPLSFSNPRLSTFTTPTKKPRKHFRHEDPVVALRRSPRKFQDKTSTGAIELLDPTSKVYTTTELLEAVLEFCDWGSLTAIGISSSKLCVLRNRVIKRRIDNFLALFVPRADHDRFFSHMKATGCAIFGGIVRCIISAGDPIYNDVYPHEMYIVAPFHPNGITTGSWRMFLGSINFDILTDDTRRQSDECPTRRILHAKHNETGMVVNVIESATPSLLPAVLAFGHTSACNLLTADNIYCLYPELIQANENIQIDTNQTFRCPTVLVPFNFGLRTYRTTGLWRFLGRPCGIHCVTVWRDSETLSGSAIVPWECPMLEDAHPRESENPLTAISSSRIRWTIGDGVCENYVCPYRGRGRRI